MVVALYIKSIADRLEERNFIAECNEVQSSIANRLEDHARILMSGVALFNASTTVTREEWRIFTQSLNVEKQLPGIQGFGYSLAIPRSELSQHIQKIRSEGFPEYHVRPAGEREVYSSIIYLEPFSGRNLRAFGYDMFSEPVRRAAMERARDTNAAALSGKVILVQETDQVVQAGTLMYVPVYRKGMPTETVEQRRAAIIGWVYSPYRMTDLLQGILASSLMLDTPGHSVSIYDEVHPSPQNLLFSHTVVKGDVRYQRQSVITFNGHPWTLCFAQTGDGLFAIRYLGVWLTLIGGVLGTILVCTLFGALLYMQSDAQHLAKSITKNLQKSEESLRQVTDRLSLAARAGGVGIWDYDVVNNLLIWDDQMFKLYGITREQFSGAYEAWQAGLHPEDRQSGDDRIQLALRGEKEFDIEFRVLWPDGTIRHIRGFALVQRDATGHPLRMIGTNWDITEQRLAGENIKRQASLINSLLDSMPDIIFFKDVTGIYLGCNPNFVQFVGRPRAEIVGKTDYDLFDKSIADAFRENDRHMLEMRESRHNEEWITYPDGRKILIDTLKTPYLGPDGELIGILGIGRDITAQRQAEVALRESEVNFRTFFETMTDMIMVGTPEGRILFTNSAVTRTLGYTPDELKEMHLLDVHPADKRQEAEFIFGAMFKGERESCPLPLQSKDGALVPVETRVWFGKWNGEHCLFGICKNLSAEQEAQQRFERLFRNNPSLIALSTLPDRRFMDVNDAFLMTLGYSREDIIGHTSAECGLFMFPEQYAAAADQLLLDTHLAGVELQIRCKDGTLLDGLFSGEVISNQGRQYFLSVMTDITARKHAEKELARLSVIQRDLMRLATEFVNVPLERQDTAIDQSLATMGQLLHADRAYLFSYDFNAGVMSNTHEWCGAGITPEIANLQAVPNANIPDWVAAHRRGECVHIPSVAGLPNDSYLWQVLEAQGIRSLITLPLMQGADCLGFVGFDAVVEERNWREEEVALLHVLAELYAHFEARRAKERETQALQERLTQARDAAQAAALAKSLFLANMSHEIRTPLNAILGYAQIMERECYPCAMKPRLKAITRSGEHLLELLTDLLELVRCDAHTITLAPKAFDFYQALEDVRLMFVRHPAAQILRLEFTFSPDVPRFIFADSGKIRQILVNLVGNAVKFTEKGSVRLSAFVLEGETPDGDIMIAVDVEDTGHGIGPDDLSRIFEVFEQTENGWKGGKGTGLGLYLSRRYAHALGGDITVTSQLGVGSRFRFTFRAQSARDEIHGQSNRNVLRLSKDQRALHLLVVDDDPASREMLATMLEPIGFTVETAASAAQALNRMRQPEPVDLILMDKRMPEMDGYEAIAQIRELPGGKTVPVVVVTASCFADDSVPALAAGANGYVSKPVQREQLLSEIGKVCDVQYDYEANQPVGSQLTIPAGVDAQALACLPEEQRNLLEQALRRGDILLLRKIVETIAHQHADLATSICVLIDSYDYDRLRGLLDSAKGITA